LIAGLSALTIISITIPLYAIINLVIVASFFSRFSILTFGFHIRPEHVTALILFIRILTMKTENKPQNFSSTSSRSRLLLAVTAVVILNVISTILNSPDQKLSFDIVGWLFMDLILLWSLLRVPEALLRRAVLRTGLTCALIMGTLAIIFWISAEAGGPLIGVQHDTAYGGYAAYVGSYEANIAAGLLVLWGLIAVASLRSSGSVVWVSRAAAIVCPLALIATDTRAAIIAYVVGAAILAVRGGVLRLRHLAIGAVIVILGITVLSLGSKSTSIGESAKKLSSFSLSSGDGALRV